MNKTIIWLKFFRIKCVIKIKLYIKTKGKLIEMHQLGFLFAFIHSPFPDILSALLQEFLLNKTDNVCVHFLKVFPSKLF